MTVVLVAYQLLTPFRAWWDSTRTRYPGPLLVQPKPRPTEECQEMRYDLKLFVLFPLSQISYQVLLSLASEELIPLMLHFNSCIAARLLYRSGVLCKIRTLRLSMITLRDWKLFSIFRRWNRFGDGMVRAHRLLSIRRESMYRCSTHWEK